MRKIIRIDSTLILVAAGVLLHLAVPAFGAPPVPRLVASDSREIRIEVPFDAPTWVEESGSDGRDYRYPAWEGLTLEGDPGQVAVPAFRLRVALPPTGAVALRSTAVPRGSARGVSFPPIPGPRPESFGRPGDPPRAVSPLAAAGATVSPEPEPRVRLIEVGWERGLRVATVEVSPVKWDPRREQAEWAQRVSFTLGISGGASPPASAPRRSDRAAEASWQRTLVNPGDAARWNLGRADAPESPGIPARWFDDAEGWVKIEIAANGVYALSREQLAEAGVPVSTVDPRTFAIYAGPLLPDAGFDTTATQTIRPRYRQVHEKVGFSEGFSEGPGALNARDGRSGMEPVAVWIPGESDGSLDAADQVIFYALGPDNFEDRFGLGSSEYVVNPYTPRTVYWLGWGVTLPEAPLRMEIANAAPAPGAPRLEDGPGRVHMERNTFYDPSMYERGYRWEEWFWEPMRNDLSPYTFSVDLPRQVPGTPASLRARFWGANQPRGGVEADSYNHNLRVDVNDAFLTLESWRDFKPLDVTGEGLATTSPLRLRATILDDFGIENRIDLIHLAWIEVFYRAAYDAAGNSLEFEVEPGAADRVVRLRRPVAGDAVVLDVTDFRRPRRLTGGVTQGSGAARTLEFAVGEPGRRFMRVDDASSFRTPAAMELDTRPERWLRDDSEPLDYVIIAYDEFVEEAEELAAFRRQHLQGITETRPARVRVVRVSDILDEFSWGMHDPAALRYFLEYAWRYYGAAGDDPLAYCLFLGDHTHDTRDHFGSRVPDLVPSWEDNRDSIALLFFGSVQYVSDDPLARFDGPGDLTTDLYLGRIPAATRDEARSVIRDKVIRSETDPDRGPWRTRAILIADDVCQGRDPDSIQFLHMSQSEDIDRVLPQGFDREKIYLYEYGEECVVDTKPEAQRDLLTVWSDGAWLVNYIGHGSDVVLADEHVFEAVDIPLLANDGRYPVFGAFSCSVGKFNKPLLQGLGESLLKTPNGGALACAVATHLTGAGSNGRLNQAFLRRMFPEAVTSPIAVGVALMEAKRSEGGASLKYVCLGDPASRPSVPELPMEVNSAPSSLRRGEIAEVHFGLPGAADLSGTVDLVAQDAREYRTQNSQGRSIPAPYYRTGSTLFRGRSPVQADSATVGFVVPLSLREGGDGKIRAYAWGEHWDAFAALTPLDVGGTTFTPGDTLGPQVSFDIPAATLRPGDEVGLTLEDPAGVDLTRLFEFRGILLKIRDSQGLEQLRLDLTERFTYDLGSYSRGTVRFNLPEIIPGSYELVVSAYDNFTNKSESSVEVEIVAEGARSRFREVAAYPNPLSTETKILFRLDRAARVSMKIYTVSGRLVQEFEMEARAGRNAQLWDGRDRRGDDVANGVYLLQMTLDREEGGEADRHLERLVVYR